MSGDPPWWYTTTFSPFQCGCIECIRKQDEIEQLRADLEAAKQTTEDVRLWWQKALADLAKAEAYLHGYRMADKMTGRESSMDAEIDTFLNRNKT